MTTLIIDTIVARPDYSTRNRANNLIPQGQVATIWAVTAQGVNEGGSGSINCCTFDVVPGAQGRIALGVQAVITGVQANTPITLVGSLRGIRLLTSDPTNLPAGGVVQVENFNVTALGFVCRLSGDWIWSVEITGLQPITYQTPTRLELNLVAFGPPQGPLNPTAPGTMARPDFQTEYPVDVFRLFLPSAEDINAMQNPVQDYLQRSLSAIWSLGQQPNAELISKIVSYETLRGAPAYIDGSEGGTFQLRRFVAGMFSTVNCYDLAGLAQLAVCIIQDNQGVEIYNPCWVYGEDYGYINDGPLIGWPQYPDCNSPFFAGSRLPHYSTYDQNRQAFGNHAWVEVDVQGNRTVLDATHCLQATPNSPAAGTQERTAYLDAQRDLLRGPYNTTFESNPGSRLDMIGVYGVGNVPAYMLSKRAAPAAGSPPDVLPALVNDASCSPESLLKLAQSEFSDAEIDLKDYVTGSKGCQALVTFRRILSTEGQMSIEVTNITSEQDALGQFRHMREQIVNGIPQNSILDSTELGPDSIRLLNTLAWIRNCTCIRILAPSVDLNNHPQLSDMLWTLAKHVDEYFTSNAVKPEDQRRSRSSLLGDQTIQVPSGEVFSVSLGQVDDTLDTKTAEIESQSTVKLLGPPSADGVFQFIAMAEGETNITLCVAHEESLAVRTHEVHVVVSQAKEDKSKNLFQKGKMISDA